MQSNSAEKLTLTGCPKLTKLLVQAKARGPAAAEPRASLSASTAFYAGAPSPGACRRSWTRCPATHAARTSSHPSPRLRAPPRLAGAQAARPPGLPEPHHHRRLERRAHGPRPHRLPVAPLGRPLLPRAARGVHHRGAAGAGEARPVAEVPAAREPPQTTVQKQGALGGKEDDRGAVKWHVLLSRGFADPEMPCSTALETPRLGFPLTQARVDERNSERSISILEYHAPRIFHAIS